MTRAENKIIDLPTNIITGFLGVRKNFRNFTFIEIKTSR